MVKKFLRLIFVLSTICNMALYDAAHKTTAAEYTDEQGYCAMWDGQDVWVRLPNGKRHNVHGFDCQYAYDDYCDCDWNFHPSAPIEEISGPVLDPQAALERYTRVRKRELEAAMKRISEEFRAKISERTKSDGPATAQSATTPEPIHEETQAVLISMDEEDLEPIQIAAPIISSDATPTLTDNSAPVGQEILSSEFFPEASHDSDAIPEHAHASSSPPQALLILCDDLPAVLYDPDFFFSEQTEKSSQAPLLSEFEKQREETLRRARQAEETLRRARQAEETVDKQARTLEALKKLVAEKNESEKKAQEAEALASEQARQITEMVALLNSSPKPRTQGPGPSSVARPIVSEIVIPEIARGYEEIYRRFLGGRLIYKPDPKSDAGRIDLPIRDLVNPLEGTFDLSGCGNTGKYLSISTGYRKGVRADNTNKVEVWLTPKFLANKKTAQHLQLMSGWNAEKAPVSVFWTLGKWTDLGWYDYLSVDSLENLSSENLFEKWERAQHTRGWKEREYLQSLAFVSVPFHVSFLS
jgi:hypothetical protein